MSLVSDLLPDIDSIRSIPGDSDLGVRPFTVKVRVRTWTGERAGLGTKTDVDTILTNAGNPIRVKQVTAKDIVASGGLYRDRDLRVGPITPSYAASIGLAAGGFGDSTIDPATSSSPKEILWNVAGPGMPSGGAWCAKIIEEVTALHYSVVLRATGHQP